MESQNPDAWPILLDANGNLCEGPGANIFLVKTANSSPRANNTSSPESARETAIQLAHELAIPVREPT